MTYAFVIIVGILGVAVYLSLMYSSIPGAVDERLGALEPLPPELGQWQVDKDSPEGMLATEQGLSREVRLLHQQARGLFGKEHFTRQVRYREATTRKITRVDPEVQLPRRRIKKKS